MYYNSKKFSFNSNNPIHKIYSFFDPKQLVNLSTSAGLTDFDSPV